MNLNERAAKCLNLDFMVSNCGEVIAAIDSKTQWKTWNPCQSRDQAAMLEAEIWKLERQARWDYRNALYREWVSSEDSENFDLWLITAPAEARVKACLAVLEENQPAEGE